jgi:hypothetical protein
LFAAAAKYAGQIPITLRKGLRRIAKELIFRESPEAQDLIDDEPRRNIAMIDDEDARIARKHGRAAAEELP